MDLIGTLGGGAMGALFGAVGSVLNRGVGIFEARERRQDRVLEMAHEKDRWVHDTSVQAATAEQQLKLTGEQGSWAGLAASVEADGRAPDSYRWVAAVRALTRPALTVLLWLVFVALFFALPRENVASLAASAVDTVSFSAATALAWWFGDRAPKRD